VIYQTAQAKFDSVGGGVFFFFLEGGRGGRGFFSFSFSCLPAVGGGGDSRNRGAAPEGSRSRGTVSVEKFPPEIL